MLAADTTVDLDGAILAKPVDEGDAASMLQRLSGRRHEVHTAVAVRYWPLGADRTLAGAATTTSVVEFVELTAADIDWYVATGEPADKAGRSDAGAGCALRPWRRRQRERGDRVADGRGGGVARDVGGWSLAVGQEDR